MPESEDIAFTVSGHLTESTLRNLKSAAERLGMTVDDYVMASAIHAAGFEGLMTGYEQAKRGEFYPGTMDDIKREARRRFEAEQD